MRVFCAKIFLCVMFIAGLLVQADKAMAFNAIETYQNQLQGKLKKGDVLQLKDPKFQNSAFDWSRVSNKTVSNMITFSIYRDGITAMPKAFKCEVDLKLEYWSSPNQVDPTVNDHIKLEINYDPTVGIAYKDEAVYRFMYGYRTQVTINNITSAELGTDLPAIFRLSSQVILERSYTFDTNTPLIPEVSLAQVATNSNVSLTWSTITGAEEYDLEWTFIDEESDNGRLLAGQGNGISNDALKKMFKNNATRVTVQQEYYDISLVNNSKYLLVRIRPVQYQQDNFRQEYAWQYQIKQGQVTTPGVIDLAATPWHESGKNWQYNAVYAEDGKKKEVVNYFDGSLRTRQTVTVNNSDKKAVVQESIYDEYGRPLASILPAPQNESAFKYYPGLHISSGTTAYNFSHVYGNASNCISTPLPLSNSKGAARYYSANNEFLGDALHPENEYIPDAEGYPLAVTRYTGDNTNRVSVQGGVGPKFQPGAIGATRYFYGKPVQLELDRLFGNDVGYASHYLKNVTVDGNGQIGIAYLNAAGKTIATALAGSGPGNVDALPSKEAPVTQTVVLMDREFSFDPSKLKISATATHISTVLGPVKLQFDISKLVKAYSESGVNICSNCYYEGNIYITDNCGNEFYKTTQPLKIGALQNACLVTDGVATYTVDTIFDVAEYYIRFELSIPESAINFYTAAYVKGNKNLKTEWNFINDALLGKDFFSCFNDCATCKESLGDLATFKSRIKQRLLADGVDVSAGTIDSWIDSLYGALSSQCAALRANCTPSPCAELEKTLLQDVSPGGQYALFDANGVVLEADLNILNLYWRQVFRPLPKDDAAYIGQQFEMEDGSISSPHDSAFTVQLLVKYWNSDWATRFIEYHPEYCALKFCQDNAASFAWDEKITSMATTVADIPGASGGAVYAKESISWLVNKDPFFTGRQNYKDLFIADLTNYSSNVLGMNIISGTSVKTLGGFVDYMLYCADYTGNTNVNNIPSKDANNWNNCQPNTACLVPDKEWALYRQKYLELKDRYYQRLRDSSNYCGGQCPVGSSISYDALGDCPAADQFVIESGSNSCSDGKQSVRISYQGRRLSKNTVVSIYYPAEYQSLAERDTVSFSADRQLAEFCISDKIPLNSLLIANVNCGNQSGDFCSTYSGEDFEFVYNEVGGSGYFRFIFGAIPAGVLPRLQVRFGDGNTQVVSTQTFRLWNEQGESEAVRYRFRNFPVIVSSTLTCANTPVTPPPTSCNDAYQYKTSRITKISYTAPTISTDTTVLKNMVSQALADMIAQNCEAQADRWMSQLDECPKLNGADTVNRPVLRKKLIEICKLGGDIDHIYGASTIPAGKPSTAEGYRSFKDAIQGIIGVDPVTLCSPYLIDAPYPYEVKAQTTEVVLESTNAAVCERLTALTTEYNAANSGDIFYVYLQKKYGTAMNITAAELALLQQGCSNCRYLLKQPVKLPVFMEKGAKGCITKAEYNQAMSDLQALAGSGLNVSHANYETIVANYLNNRFGFTLSYGDYQAYKDAIEKPQAPDILLCNHPVFSSVKQDQYECMMMVLDDAVVSGKALYRDYIDEVKRLFRKDYIAVCGSNKPKVSLTEQRQVYHYTLYYYDQAGNLIRTIPPEGVHPLSDAEAAQVGAARDIKELDCSNRFQPDNKTKDVVLQMLTDAFDKTTGEAMEMWLYNAGSGESQVLATTGGKKYLFNVCVSGGYLNFDVYTISASGGNADFVLSAHSAVSLAGVSPLTKWTHVVVQGSGFNGNNRDIYVNGTRCPAVVINASGACGWEVSSNAGVVTFPENFNSLRHLRVYNHLLSDDVIAANAGVACLSPSAAYVPTNGDALVLWATFNNGTTPGGGTGGGSDPVAYSPIYPTHTLTTSYTYQSLNGIQAQNTPDAGTSHFWYDLLGRLVVSQNAEQKTPARIGVSNRLSFTLYDQQGRIVQVGEKINAIRPLDADAFIGDDPLKDLYDAQGQQVTKTYYDFAPWDIQDIGIADAQDNLRKRVTATTFSEYANSDPQHVTYYSYDQLGNVKTLWQWNPTLGLKKIDYQYDLVSGKVNQVGYQRGEKDRFLYAYEYDAENRLTKAVSGINVASSDGWYIEASHTDASYRYLLHGPLARMELGNANLVQGVDYAYTLQGWLKGVNGHYLQSDKDMGIDGVAGRMRSTVAKDVYAYTLDYFKDDYKPVGANTAFSLEWTKGDLSEIGADLFNGNISHSTLAVKYLNDKKTVGYSYRYDQLNRLKAMRQHSLVPGTTKWNSLNFNKTYSEDITYDGNGNILTYLRNGDKDAQEKMDQLTYVYAKDASGNLLHNKLLQVKDDVVSSAYAEDIDNQNANNYIYDNIGNLIADSEGKIENVTWTAYGKIDKIKKTDGTQIEYSYDAAGNRVYKQTRNSSGVVIDRTWYVRDAQGNTLAVYGNKDGDANIYWKEQQLYGSSHLGTWNPDMNVTQDTSINGWLRKGLKEYELVNHLGNVLATISDKVVDSLVGAQLVSYEPEVLTAQDYYPFGMLQPGRKWNLGAYRYGFNGKENDNEVKGEGNQQDYGMRVYDPRVGKFLSVDPLSPQYPELTPYQFASNTPIQAIDLDGKEADWFMLEWLEEKMYGSSHLTNVRKGFTERGIGMVKGMVNIPKVIVSWLGSGPLTTIADPRVKEDYEAQQREAFLKQSSEIIKDYVNLFDRASKGEDKAIGELAFEAAMLVVPGGEEAKMGELAVQAAKLEGPIARVSKRLMGLKDRNLVKYDVKYFGSRIKGTNRLNSDLDVLILTEETELFKEGSRLDKIVGEIKKDFFEETGIELDVNIMDTKTYNVAKQGQFKLDVERHAKKVVRPNKPAK